MSGYSFFMYKYEGKYKEGLNSIAKTAGEYYNTDMVFDLFNKLLHF